MISVFQEHWFFFCPLNNPVNVHSHSSGLLSILLLWVCLISGHWKKQWKIVLSTFLRFFPTATALLMHCAAVSRESANSDIQTLDFFFFFFVGHEDVRVEVDRHQTKGNNERVGTCTLANIPNEEFSTVSFCCPLCSAVKWFTLCRRSTRDHSCCS